MPRLKNVLFWHDLGLIIANLLTKFVKKVKFSRWVNKWLVIQVIKLMWKWAHFVVIFLSFKLLVLFTVLAWPRGLILCMLEISTNLKKCINHFTLCGTQIMCKICKSEATKSKRFLFLTFYTREHICVYRNCGGGDFTVMTTVIISLVKCT